MVLINEKYYITQENISLDDEYDKAMEILDYCRA